MATHEPRAETPQVAVVCCLRDQKYSDLVIKCGGTNFRVRKIVVCPQCKFLENACKEEWEKKTVYENVEMTYIELLDDTPLPVKALIEWLYTHQYSVFTEEECNDKRISNAWAASETIGHAQVYVTAEKYGITGLRELAKTNIQNNLGPTKKNSDFHNVIREVYDNTGPDDTLRQTLSGFASLYAKEEFATDGKFGKLMLELPEFGKDVAEYLCGSRAYKGLLPARLETIVDFELPDPPMVRMQSTPQSRRPVRPNAVPSTTSTISNQSSRSRRPRFGYNFARSSASDSDLE